MNKKFDLKKYDSVQRFAPAAMIAMLLVVSLLLTPVPTASADGSPEWTFVTIPGLPDGAFLGQLWTNSPNNVYVWAEVGNPRAAYLYHWNGITWGQELALPGYRYGSIHGNSADDIFVSVSCYETDCAGLPKMFHYDGTSWQEQPLPSFDGSRVIHIAGVPGEVQASLYGPNQSPAIIVRYDYNSETWNQIHTMSSLTYTKGMYFLSASEAYYASCWGHARWNGSVWETNRAFDFCDLNDMWGIRDDMGNLHLYVVGNNNFSNGIRVWKYTENPNPALLGTFGSKCGFVFGDPFNCGGGYHIGSARGIWGSAWNDVYVIGEMAPGSDLERTGRVYHYDGTSWQRLTEFGNIPRVHDVWGSGPDDIWFTLHDGRLLHFGVLNTPPELTVDYAVVSTGEGDFALNGGSVSDSDGDAVLLSSSSGEVINNNDGSWSWSFLTTDGPAESQTVTITAEDGKGGTASASFDLTVNNGAPSIKSVLVPAVPVNIGDGPVSASATFNDPAGAYDEPYSCSVDYGDGSGGKPGIAESTTCSGPEHSYAEPGVYTVTVTVTDKDGGSSNTAATNYIVIYDPDGGFVTGGGWIWSPGGAYTPDPSLTGKATFGFVSKYKKGASVPTGNTEFQFKVADLNFKSTAYNWLVIAGKKAMYKGTGTINGIGEYGFMISAIDGTPDKFRIKIWDKTSDEMIYDNQLGALDDAEPATELGGGSIVVHKK